MGGTVRRLCSPAAEVREAMERVVAGVSAALARADRLDYEVRLRPIVNDHDARSRQRGGVRAR